MASIDKRPDRTYRARWREYPGGPQRTKHFTRKVDAERFLVKVQHDLAIGAYVSPESAQVTLEEYVRTHLARQPWRGSTASVAANALEHHALPFLGPGRPLGTIRRADVQALVASLDLAPSTVRTVVQHVGQLFSAAVEDHLIALNPAIAVRLPQSGTGEVVPPTLEEVNALVEAAPAWFTTAIALGAGLGLRQAEASGLTADRIDWLKDQTVRVDRQWSSRHKPAGFAPLKSPSSYRTIPAADSVLAELARVVGNPTSFVLHEHDDHTPVDHNRFEHVWRKAVRAAGLPPGTRYHTLRHRFASVLISGGCSVVAVQRAMGHSTPAITLGIYGHLMPSDDDRVRLAVEQSLRAEDLVRTGTEDTGR